MNLQNLKYTGSVALLLGLIFTLPISAQNRTRFVAEYSALDYAYGVVGAPPALAVQSGNSATGSQTITVQVACVPLGDGTTVCPLATNAPINIGTGAGNIDTVTPTGVSNCFQGSAYGTCQITATFTYTHGTGEPITSASYGLQEAINAAHSAGGGTAVVNGAWAAAGGTSSTITSAGVYSNVFVTNRGANNLNSLYWTVQPTTLTVLAAPTTLVAANIVFTAATGTWAASSTHFLATCVDALGGESAASADYTQTPTLNYTLTVPVPPTCATGAVGWRLYAGTSSSALTYLLPASGCATQTTLESVVPACALTSTGTWAATFTTTTNLSPVALGVTNTSNPVPQGHTTFGYEPTGSNPVPFQTSYGPFGSGTIASATASDNTILGSFNLPPGYMNQIGRSVRVTGKIKMTAGASSTLGIGIGTVWAGGVTAGAPITVCNPVSGFVFATAASVVDFSCTMTTNAVGATAVGTVQPESWFLGNTAAGTGTTSPQGVEVAAGTISSLGLFAQNEFSVYLQPLVAADTTVQLMSLHVETLQ